MAYEPVHEIFILTTLSSNKGLVEPPQTSQCTGEPAPTRQSILGWHPQSLDVDED